MTPITPDADRPTDPLAHIPDGNNHAVIALAATGIAGAIFPFFIDYTTSLIGGVIMALVLTQCTWLSVKAIRVACQFAPDAPGRRYGMSVAALLLDVLLITAALWIGVSHGGTTL